MPRRHHRSACALLLALFSVGIAGADSGEVLVSVTVEASCTIIDSGELDFGVLNPTSDSPATASGTLSYWCTKGTRYTIRFDKGENYDAGRDQRQMAQVGGSGTIPYALQEPPGNPHIGNGPAPPETFQMTATIRAADIKRAPAADYQDNLVVTIEP